MKDGEKINKQHKALSLYPFNIVDVLNAEDDSQLIINNRFLTLTSFLSSS